MKNFLFPDRYIKSVYTHNFEEEYKSGKKGLIFDIDNTLVPHDHKATKEYTELIKKLKEDNYFGKGDKNWWNVLIAAMMIQR